MKFFYPNRAVCIFWLCCATPLWSHAVEYPASVIPSGQLRFIENKNQWDEKILYNAKLWAGDLFLEKNTFTYYFFNPDDLKKVHHQMDKGNFTIHAHAFKEVFLNANPDVRTSALSPSLYHFNYFIGNDPKRWATQAIDGQPRAPLVAAVRIAQW